jgi:protein O-GlcNAc transferase
MKIKGAQKQLLISRVHSDYNAGKYRLAYEGCRNIVSLYPEDAAGWRMLGLCQLKIGKIDESLVAMNRVIQLAPTDAASHSNIGLVLKMLGRLQEAELSYLKAINLNPLAPEAYSNLGNLLYELNRFKEAEMACREAIRLNPNFVQAHINLGNALMNLRLLKEARMCFERAIMLEPRRYEAYSNLGVIDFEVGSLFEAEARIRKAILIKPDYPEAHNNLGTVLFDLRRLSEAAASYRQAISLKPDFAEAYSNLGNVLKHLWRLVDARACYEEAIRLKMNFEQAFLNLGNVLQELGDFSGAENSYREALRLNPEMLEAHHNLLFLLNYDCRRSESEIFDEYRGFGKYINSRYSQKYTHAPDKLFVNRKIRIGYSSADFKEHACRFFIEPLLRHHDKTKFELFAYSNVKIGDDHTEQLKQYFDKWIDVFTLTDEQMAQRIFDDKIDILVDLSGHTSGSRLPVFAMKPAPLQVTYPVGTGYTSGLSEIDYFIGNNDLTPNEYSQLYSENLWRLPSVICCYDPSGHPVPKENSLPFLKNGFITFGSLARPVRMNDEVLLSWAEIMNRVPYSRLRLDQKIFSDEQTKNIYLTRMERLGMPIERIDLANSIPHWIGYHEIDMSLDCFPHNAGTTTFESLWMGVPVLTKTSSLSIGRLGASVLSPIGLDSWIASTKEDYIQKAVSFSGQVKMLTMLRSSLREKLKKSVFMEHESLTRDIEQAYQRMVERSI